MAVLKCKMCGGEMELSADKTFGTCEFCGCTMTLPKIDDEQRAAAFNRGNHFRRIGEFDKALSVYERIVAEDDTDAEAHWCCTLCRFGIEYVEDPATLEWVPTCHRASFDSILEDVDYLAALEHSDGVTKRQYQKDAAKIAEVQKGILATSQNEEPFDVFICYKESDANGDRTRDSQLAQEIYYQLNDKGYRTFFARITLEDKVGTQYEPYIFAALNSAKVMVVVGTCAEHLNAVWVKNEWSRFLALMKKDRSKLLLPCYRDMDPYDLPDQLNVLQSYDMSKIGFIQDLIRGISKVLDADKKTETVQVIHEVAAQQMAVNVEPLLKRGQMALEDGDWIKADSFFEEVLNQMPECAQAYLGKALAKEKCSNMEEFVTNRLRMTQNAEKKNCFVKPDNARIDKAVRENVIENYFSEQQVRYYYKTSIYWVGESLSREIQLRDEKQKWEENRLLMRAEQYATGELAQTIRDEKARLFNTMEERLRMAQQAEASTQKGAEAQYVQKLNDADRQVAEYRQYAENCRERDYNEAVRLMGNALNPQQFYETAVKFEALKDYKDSEARRQNCEKQARELELELQRLRDAYQRSEEQRRKNRQKFRGYLRFIYPLAVLLLTAIGYTLSVNIAERTGEDMIFFGWIVLMVIFCGGSVLPTIMTIDSIGKNERKEKSSSNLALGVSFIGVVLSFIAMIGGGINGVPVSAVAVFLIHLVSLGTMVFYKIKLKLK